MDKLIKYWEEINFVLLVIIAIILTFVYNPLATNKLLSLATFGFMGGCIGISLSKKYRYYACSGNIFLLIVFLVLLVKGI